MGNAVSEDTVRDTVGDTVLENGDEHYKWNPREAHERRKRARAHWVATYGPVPPVAELLAGGYPLQCWMCYGIYVQDGKGTPEGIRVGTHLIADPCEIKHLCPEHYEDWKLVEAASRKEMADDAAKADGDAP